MENSLAQSIVNQLSSLAGDVLTSTSSLAFWGEVEVPECMREQTENHAE